MIAAPLITVADELKHVERFELDQVRAAPSRIVELENLSSAIADMAGGLAAFGKYIPADLVRMLLREGVETAPGWFDTDADGHVRRYRRLYWVVRAARRSDHSAALRIPRHHVA